MRRRAATTAATATGPPSWVWATSSRSPSGRRASTPVPPTPQDDLAIIDGYLPRLKSNSASAFAADVLGPNSSTSVHTLTHGGDVGTHTLEGRRRSGHRVRREAELRREPARSSERHRRRRHDHRHGRSRQCLVMGAGHHTSCRCHTRPLHARGSKHRLESPRRSRFHRLRIDRRLRPERRCARLDDEPHRRIRGRRRPTDGDHDHDASSTRVRPMPLWSDHSGRDRIPSSNSPAYPPTQAPSWSTSPLSPRRVPDSSA